MITSAAWLSALLLGLCRAQPYYPLDSVDLLAIDSLPYLRAWLEQHPQDGCTFETAAKRKEWYVFDRRRHMRVAWVNNSTGVT